jgi:hypothetical protein
VGVDLARDVRTAVVEAVAHDVDVDALLQGEGRPCVAEAVELEPRKRLAGVGPRVTLALSPRIKHTFE